MSAIDTTGCIRHRANCHFYIAYEDYLEIAPKKHNHKLAAFWRVLEVKTNERELHQKTDQPAWIEITYQDFVTWTLGLFQKSSFQVADKESEQLGFSKSRVCTRPHPGNPDKQECYKEYILVKENLQYALDGNDVPYPPDSEAFRDYGTLPSSVFTNKYPLPPVESNTPPVEKNSPPIKNNRGGLLKITGGHAYPPVKNNTPPVKNSRLYYYLEGSSKDTDQGFDSDASQESENVSNGNNLDFPFEAFLPEDNAVFPQERKPRRKKITQDTLLGDSPQADPPHIQQQAAPRKSPFTATQTAVLDAWDTLVSVPIDRSNTRVIKDMRYLARVIDAGNATLEDIGRVKTQLESLGYWKSVDFHLVADKFSTTLDTLRKGEKKPDTQQPTKIVGYKDMTGIGRQKAAYYAGLT